jgi:hypothetical protein
MHIDLYDIPRAEGEKCVYPHLYQQLLYMETVCASQQRDDRLPARNSRLLGIFSMKSDFPASSVLRDLRPSFQFEFD